jgi:DNA-directed RNA polymerase subunit RPC12/RpoP
MLICDKCGGHLVNDVDFVYNINYIKCMKCGKRFMYKEEKMDILIKIPTRERPVQFFSILELCIRNLEDKAKTKFLITLDTDDSTMNTEEIKNFFNFYRESFGVEIDVVYGTSINKIDAINRDLDSYKKNWDILVLTSDDMIPVTEGYDSIIREKMKSTYADTDGVLFFPDGYTNLNTLPIIGKKYYKRFNYIYNPKYKSFFCDNLFHEVADFLNRQYHGETVLFKHEHPANTKVSWDNLYEKNNSTWDIDYKTYLEDRSKLFLNKEGV